MDGRLGGGRACSLEGGDDVYPSVEVVDEHLAGPDVSCNVSRVFDPVVEFPEPFEVVAASPQPPAVLLLDDPKEERHAPSVDPITQSGAGPKVPTLSLLSGPRRHWFRARKREVGGPCPGPPHLHFPRALKKAEAPGRFKQFLPDWAGH